MPQFWCPSCHQFYSETGYCPFDGARLSIPPDAISYPVKAISAHEEIDAVALALHASEQNAAYEQRVVGGSVLRRKFCDRMASEFGNVEAVAPRDDLPQRIERAQLGVNPLLSSLPFGLVHHFQ